MNHYSYTKNIYHSCEAEGCYKKSFYQVYPSGQPAGIMHGTVYMCKNHFNLFKERYWKSVDQFFKHAMNGKMCNRIHVIS